MHCCIVDIYIIWYVWKIIYNIRTLYIYIYIYIYLLGERSSQPSNLEVPICAMVKLYGIMVSLQWALGIISLPLFWWGYHPIFGVSNYSNSSFEDFWGHCPFNLDTPLGRSWHGSCWPRGLSGDVEATAIESSLYHQLRKESPGAARNFFRLWCLFIFWKVHLTDLLLDPPEDHLPNPRLTRLQCEIVWNRSDILV